MNNNNIFWLDNPKVLIQSGNLDKFFPNSEMNTVEKLNSIMRFGIYLTLIIYITKRNYKILYLLLIIACLTIFINYFENNEFTKKIGLNTVFDNFKLQNGNLYFPKKIKKEKGKKCIAPENSNPFMNRLLFNEDNPDAEACPYYSNAKDYSNWNSEFNNDQDKTIKDIVEDKFNINLYKNVNDIFDRNNSQRQYYTTPVTSVVNKQTDFAKWLYNVPETCKDGNGEQCVANNPNIVNATLPNLNLRYK